MRNEDVIAICVMGYDANESQEDNGRTKQADAIMVLAFDTSSKKLTCIAVPRDSMAQVDVLADNMLASTSTMQLCLAFGYSDDHAVGAANVAKSVQRILMNMPITYYYALNETALVDMNDAVGGVSLTALSDIPSAGISKGDELVLMGKNALTYVQYRDTNVMDSSVDRQARQTQYVQAFMQKVLGNVGPGQAGVLLDLFNLMASNSTTNLGLSEFTYLATQLVSSGAPNVTMVSLQGEMRQGAQYAEFYLNEDNVRQVVMDVFYKPVS